MAEWNPVLSQTGMKLGGLKYMYVSGDEKIVRGRRGNTSGVHIVKTVQAAIVAVYDEPTMPQQCASTTEALSDYLISVGY